MMYLRTTTVLVGVTLYVLVLTGATLGAHHGSQADSLEDAKVNETVRQEAYANVSEPAPESSDPAVVDWAQDLPDPIGEHFETEDTNEPPPGWVQSIVKSALWLGFSVAGVVGGAVYQYGWVSAEWLVPVFEFLTVVPIIVLAWHFYNLIEGVRR